MSTALLISHLLNTDSKLNWIPDTSQPMYVLWKTNNFPVVAEMGDRLATIDMGQK